MPFMLQRPDRNNQFQGGPCAVVEVTPQASGRARRYDTFKVVAPPELAGRVIVRDSVVTSRGDTRDRWVNIGMGPARMLSEEENLQLWGRVATNAAK